MQRGDQVLGRSHTAKPREHNGRAERSSNTSLATEGVCTVSVLAQSGFDSDYLIPVGRLLVGVGGPHEKRVVKEPPDELSP